MSLAKQGFVRVAVLHWSDGQGTFEIRPEDDREWRAQHVVYAWMDAARGRCLNVGHTSQTVAARFGDYRRWLNGLRRNDSDTAVRLDWLECLETCVPSAVEVWVRRSAVDKVARVADEQGWIERLSPLLNVMRHPDGAWTSLWRIARASDPPARRGCGTDQAVRPRGA